MPKIDPDWAKGIAEARHNLPESKKLIADAPLYMNGIWWPNNPWKPDLEHFHAHMGSDYGITEDRTGFADDFRAEIIAMKKIVERNDGVPDDLDFKKFSEKELLQFVQADANRLARAFEVWERIAYPVRRKGELIFRIFAPRNLMGSPIIQAMPIDEFVQGVSRHTAEQAVKINHLNTVLRRWRWAAIILGAIEALELLNAIRALLH